MLYRETRTWYRTYGVSDRLLPRTRPEFAEYFADACATQLRVGPAAHEFRDQVLRPDAWIVRYLPAGAARAMQHPRALALFDVRPTPADTAALRAVALTARTGFTMAPQRIRSVSQARARTVR